MSKFLFTSESVTEGHPDKICDQISDAVLDEILAHDPMGRVACETTTTTGLVSIMGEISTSCYVDIAKIARNVVLDIGYNKAEYSFDGHSGVIKYIFPEGTPSYVRASMPPQKFVYDAKKQELTWVNLLDPTWEKKHGKMIFRPKK